MKRILFLIHDLGQGGAEKVLVNLVNHMDTGQFDITVMSLFDIGINKQFLKPNITYKSCFRRMPRGNSHLMKLLSPRQLHKWLIKEHYDIEIAYLEGPCARIISGCPHEDTKLVSWIHIQQHTQKRAASSFRSVKEAESCYNRMDQIVCVSQGVQKDFLSLLNIHAPVQVLYNTNESDKIRKLSKEPVPSMAQNCVKLVGVGKLLKSKGFDRIVRIVGRLFAEGYSLHLYLLGTGPEQSNLESLIRQLDLTEHVTFLGYQTNPYRFLSKCDLFVCASFAEGFSTAATEALIVGTPVCTVEVSGMKEMLGEHNEYGIVTKNDENALYEGIKCLLDNPAMLQHYTNQACLRGKDFSTEETVRAVEDMLFSL